MTFNKSIELLALPENEMLKGRLTITDANSFVTIYLTKFDLLELQRKVNQAVEKIEDTELKEFYNQSDEDKRNSVEL